jgi:hypothetical protein
MVGKHQGSSDQSYSGISSCHPLRSCRVFTKCNRNIKRHQRSFSFKATTRVSAESISTESSTRAKTGSDSYRAIAGKDARYADVRADQLMKTPGVRERIEELKTEAADKCSLSREAYIRSLVEMYEVKPSDASMDNPRCDVVVVRGEKQAVFPPKLSPNYDFYCRDTQRGPCVTPLMVPDDGVGLRTSMPKLHLPHWWLSTIIRYVMRIARIYFSFGVRLLILLLTVIVDI